MSCSEPGSLGVGIVASARMECLRPGQLLEEAEHLWAAERNEEKLGGISADWGAVCVLRNPSAGPPQEILDAWHARVKAARKSYVAFPVAEGEEQFFDAATGYALCTWPTDCETNQPLVGFDLLLMTATKPTLNGNQYPTTQEIAQAWRADDGGNVRYFYNNRHHGITTFQDPQILSLLRNELS